MTSRKQLKSDDTPTEEKIRNAARNVFHKKGYAATRTRDIAEEAGLNLALLNYYFRSKKKLFDIIMLESMKDFLMSMKNVVNDESTSVESKIEILVSNYIDLLIEKPDIPLFVLSELRENPTELIEKTGIKQVLMKSYFFKQVQHGIESGAMPDIHPLHFVMNLIGLIVFPFIASPILVNLVDMKPEQYIVMMQQRKKLIPEWINSMMVVR